MKNIKFTFQNIILFILFILFSHIQVLYGENAPLPFVPIDFYNEINSITADSEKPLKNPVHMVIVFSKFLGEAPGDSLAPEWADRLFDGEKGSIPYYFDEISFGQIKVTGEYLPKRYELPRDSTYYVHHLSRYTNDLLEIIDNDKSVYLTDYDNDGPDGIPGSADDDGFVDYIVLMPMSRPYNFIRRGATGRSTLSISDIFHSNDYNLNHSWTMINSSSGCISTGVHFNQAMGTICHEYIHTFGLPDLYDTKYTDNDSESGGIGFWGIMGQGAIGWDFQGGPIGPNAYTRMRLGIIGINNSNLEDLLGDHNEVRINDVGLENGKVYRIWINNNEYFLIENRRNDSTYCDRDIPNNGLLIWHINENASGNTNENIKLCDLEAADGKYLDAGYPLGTNPNADEGMDNLDFWSINSGHSTKYGGNLGDATDVFDGINFTSFGTRTNPNTNSAINNSNTDIEIYNIRSEGKEIVFDVSAPPLTDWSKAKYPLIGLGYPKHEKIFMHPNNSAPKGNVVYIINNGINSNADELITVFEDSLTVDNIDSLNYMEIQTIIDSRIVSDNLRNYNSRIVRENISLTEFSDELTDKGFSPDELGYEKTPRWIQKISIIFNDMQRPETIALSQNYPNPFNAQTSVNYSMKESGPITLEVYNLLGQKVLTIDRGYEEAGDHSMIINPEGLSSGIYLYRIIGQKVSETRKLLLIR
ncbi:T9SS type A sorting domain-containing protein [Candidatus Latescibacterota bacterium]